MNTARLPLILLLWLIAVVSVGGAGIALLSDRDTYESQDYFLLLVLLMLAVLAPLVNILHRPAFRAGGVVLCVFFLSILALLLLSIVGWLSSDKVFGTLEIVLFIGIPAGVALLVRQKKWAPAFTWTLTTIATVSGVAALLGIWLPGGSVASKLIYCSFVLLIYGGSGSILLINVGRGDKRYFRWPAIAVAMVAVVLGVMGQAKSDDWNDPLAFWARVFGLFAMTLAFINMILMTQRTGLVRLFQRSTIIAATLTGMSALLFTVADHYVHDSGSPVHQWAARCLDATLYLTVGGTLCLLTARELLRVKCAPTSLPGIAGMQIICPNCHTPGVVRLNGACPACLLQFRITLIEPKCPQCDHLLLNLNSDRCTECGFQLKRPVPPELSPDPAPATTSNA